MLPYIYFPHQYVRQYLSPQINFNVNIFLENIHCNLLRQRKYLLGGADESVDIVNRQHQAALDQC